LLATTQRAPRRTLEDSDFESLPADSGSETSLPGGEEVAVMRNQLYPARPRAHHHPARAHARTDRDSCQACSPAQNCHGSQWPSATLVQNRARRPGNACRRSSPLIPASSIRTLTSWLAWASRTPKVSMTTPLHATEPAAGQRQRDIVACRVLHRGGHGGGAQDACSNTRNRSRHRPRVGPMLPTGRPSWSDISA